MRYLDYICRIMIIVFGEMMVRNIMYSSQKIIKGVAAYSMQVPRIAFKTNCFKR